MIQTTDGYGQIPGNLIAVTVFEPLDEAGEWAWVPETLMDVKEQLAGNWDDLVAALGDLAAGGKFALRAAVRANRLLAPLGHRVVTDAMRADAAAAMMESG